MSQTPGITAVVCGTLDDSRRVLAVAKVRRRLLFSGPKNNLTHRLSWSSCDLACLNQFPLSAGTFGVMTSWLLNRSTTQNTEQLRSDLITSAHILYFGSNRAYQGCCTQTHFNREEPLFAWTARSPAFCVTFGCCERATGPDRSYFKTSSTRSRSAFSATWLMCFQR
jgi:hypothetical protein